MRLADYSVPLERSSQYYALLGLVQTTRLTRGFDLKYLHIKHSQCNHYHTQCSALTFCKFFLEQQQTCEGNNYDTANAEGREHNNCRDCVEGYKYKFAGVVVRYADDNAEENFPKADFLLFICGNTKAEGAGNKEDEEQETFGKVGAAPFLVAFAHHIAYACKHKQCNQQTYFKLGFSVGLFAAVDKDNCGDSKTEADNLQNFRSFVEDYNGRNCRHQQAKLHKCGRQYHAVGFYVVLQQQKTAKVCKTADNAKDNGNAETWVRSEHL